MRGTIGRILAWKLILCLPLRVWVPVVRVPLAAQLTMTLHPFILHLEFIAPSMWNRHLGFNTTGILVFVGEELLCELIIRRAEPRVPIFLAQAGQFCLNPFAPPIRTIFEKSIGLVCVGEVHSGFAQDRESIEWPEITDTL